MTPEEKQKRIAALEAEIAELKKPEKTAGQRFWELVSGTEVKFDFKKYPRTLFGFRDGEYVWEFDFRNNYLWLRYSTVWSVLETEYSLDYDDVQALVKNVVEEHFKCGGVTPCRIRRIPISQVEEHFNCKGVTPAAAIHVDEWNEVESYFNRRSERTTITKENAPTNKIVIEVKGGNVISVFSTQKDLQVIILDYDNFADGKEMDETEREAERQIKNKEGIYSPVFSIFKHKNCTNK